MPDGLRAVVSTGTDDGGVEFLLDLGVYPLEVVMGSGYVFIDRCYVFIDKTASDKARVVLGRKPVTPPEAMPGIAGDFQNELLSQALRLQIGARHDRLREVLVTRALFGAAPELDEGADTTLGDIDAELAGSPHVPADSDDYLDDPLGIAVPWEQKAAAADGAAAPAAPAADPAPAAQPAAEPERGPGGEAQ
ncbi:MAG TPA: hypothetical protein VGQ83_36765 [Polyangia bacterium]|jgi:His-Xaa-Ser system protein HxsD